MDSRDTTKRSEPTCLAVVGMHRSGTSATAGLALGFGLAGPLPSDLFPALDSNELGHWESMKVIKFNRRALKMRGTTVHDPPPPSVGWERGPEYDELRTQMSQWFQQTSGGRSVVVKDPRLCLTMPLWRSALDGPVAAVLVVRNPMNVAQSLQKRDGITLILGLAMWDRYLRSALLGLEGLPTLVIEYDGLLADPVGTSRQLGEFLDHLGVERTSDGNATERIEPALRHHTHDDAKFEDFANTQLDMFSIMCTQVGRHDAWRPPDLPYAPAWVDDVLSMRRDLEVMKKEYRFATRSFASRVDRRVRRILGQPVTRQELVQRRAAKRSPRG